MPSSSLGSTGRLDALAGVRSSGRCGHRRGLDPGRRGRPGETRRPSRPGWLACLEMMSGAAWVRDQLQPRGWTVQIADARKAKAVGSLAAKTDKLDARVLAELARRDLVPAGARADVRRSRAQGAPGPADAHGPAADRSDEPRAWRPQPVRGHARVQAAARARREELLIERGIPEVWRRSVAEARRGRRDARPAADTARAGAASARAC